MINIFPHQWVDESYKIPERSPDKRYDFPSLPERRRSYLGFLKHARVSFVRYWPPVFENCQQGISNRLDITLTDLTVLITTAFRTQAREVWIVYIRKSPIVKKS
jgi:hypothetical protein